MSSSPIGAASRMRLAPALPAISAMARKGSRASRSCGSVLGATVLHGEAAGLAARHRHPVRKGKRQHGTGASRIRLARLAGNRPYPSARQAPHVLGPAAAIAAEALNALDEIGTVAPQPAFGHDGGDLGSQHGFAAFLRRHDHASQAGRQGKGRKPPAHVGKPAILVQCLDGNEQRARFCERRLGRWVEPGQAERIGDAPGGNRKQRAEIGGEHLRLAKAAQAPVSASSHSR